MFKECLPYKIFFVQSADIENYMAQYGYQAPPPLEESLFDIFADVTPPAAGDLPPAESGVAESVVLQPQDQSAPVGEADCHAYRRT
jgi:hypothetical protein